MGYQTEEIISRGADWSKANEQQRNALLRPLRTCKEKGNIKNTKGAFELIFKRSGTQIVLTKKTVEATVAMLAAVSSQERPPRGQFLPLAE